jgi:hypothetical protein
MSASSVTTKNGQYLDFDLEEAEELTPREPQCGSVPGLPSQDWKILSNCTSSSSFVNLVAASSEDSLLHA